MSYRESGASSALVYVAFGSHLVAMDRATGRRIWETDIDGRYTARLVVEGERVYVLAGVLECFDAMTGRRIWRRPATGSTLLVDGDVCFVGGEGAVTCVAAHDGRQLWTDGFKGYGIGWVAIAVPGHAAQADAS